MADVQILRGTSVTPIETFSVNNAPIDLDTGVPTVTALFPDGSALTPAPVATHVEPAVSNVGKYQIVLDAQPEVTALTLTWVGTIGGKVQTLRSRVEWVGALLFNLADLRALKIGNGTPFASSSSFPDAKLHEARSATLAEFSRILGWSPVRRYAREIHDGTGCGVLFVDRHAAPDSAHTLLSVTVNGVAQTVGNYTLQGTGKLIATSNYVASGTFTAGISNVAVGYAHGWEWLDGDASNVAMLRAAMRLQPAFSSTASSVVTPDGTVYSMDPAGQVTQAGRVREFGVPAIDSWLNRWNGVEIGIA